MNEIISSVIAFAIGGIAYIAIRVILKNKRKRRGTAEIIESLWAKMNKQDKGGKEMNRCKGCIYWKWVKADKLYQTPGYHYCEKNKLTTCARRAGEKEHYRITIDIVAEPDGVDRCSDIEHLLYLNKHELVPYTVRAEDVKYKVELLKKH